MREFLVSSRIACVYTNKWVCGIDAFHCYDSMKRIVALSFGIQCLDETENPQHTLNGCRKW